jgi:hypothetical protein
MGYLFMLFVLFFDFRKLSKNLVRIILTNTIAKKKNPTVGCTVLNFKKYFFTIQKIGKIKFRHLCISPI